MSACRRLRRRPYRQSRRRPRHRLRRRAHRRKTQQMARIAPLFKGYTSVISFWDPHSTLYVSCLLCTTGRRPEPPVQHTTYTLNC